MGVLKNPKEFLSCPTFTDPTETLNSTYVDSDLESIATTVSNTAVTQQQHQILNVNNQTTRAIKTRRTRQSKIPKATYFNKAECRRIKGNRHARRHENMCYLLSLVEETELDLDDEVKYEDLVNPQSSAFSRIMREAESLQIWTDFISRTGQEQDEIIDYAEKINRRKMQKKNKHNDSSLSLLDDYGVYNYESDNEKLKRLNTSDDEYELLNDYLKEKYVNIEKRLLKSENSFQKIDKNIRGIMKRNIAYDMLVNYEETLISTFSNLPDSVYISKLPTSFDRLIMHGICQYLDLNSKSFDKDGERHTQVENNRKHFKMPSLLLSEYVKLKFSEQTNVPLTTITE